MKTLYLSIVIGIFLISLISSASYSDCSVYGTCNIKKSTITNIYNSTGNTTSNVTVNTTQFDSSDPIHIKESWLTNFIQSIVGAYNYITGNDVPDYEEDPNYFSNPNAYYNETGDTWLYSSTNIIYFNESRLATIYYNATSAINISGTILGDISLTRHPNGQYDSQTINISEQVSAPALDLRVNFSDGITQFNNGIMRYYTSPTINGDLPIIQLWDYEDNDWEDYPPIAQTSTFRIIDEGVFDWSSHVQNGTVQMRIYKASNGNTNNKYYVDWLAISKGFGTPAGEEVDPYSYHKTENINASGYNVTADYFFGDGSQLTNLPIGYNGTDGINGTNGTDGTDGLNGTDGQSTYIETEDLNDGTFLWKYFYSNGTNYANFTTSNLTGPQGIQGIQGPAGVDGINGTNGVDGINGTNGIDGLNGIDGINGTFEGILNETQFNNVSDEYSIDESWLTNFIQAIVTAYNYITGTDVPTYEQDLKAYNGTLAYNSSLSNYYPISNPYGYYNSTTLPPSGGNESWNESYANTLYYPLNSNPNSYTTNVSALAYVNSTGLIKDWNSSGYIKDWNSTGLILNWSNVITGGGNSSFNQTLTDSLYYLKTNPSNYWNSTFALFNKTYADTIYLNRTSEALYTTTFNSTYNVLLNQNCPTGQVVNGTLANGSFKCTTVSGGSGSVNGTSINVSSVIISSLINCDTINTTSTGQLICGNDATGNGTGGDSYWDRNTSYNYLFPVTSGDGIIADKIYTSNVDIAGETAFDVRMKLSDGVDETDQGKGFYFIAGRGYGTTSETSLTGTDSGIIYFQTLQPTSVIVTGGYEQAVGGNSGGITQFISNGGAGVATDGYAAGGGGGQFTQVAGAGGTAVAMTDAYGGTGGPFVLTPGTGGNSFLTTENGFSTSGDAGYLIFNGQPGGQGHNYYVSGYNDGAYLQGGAGSSLVFNGGVGGRALFNTGTSTGEGYGGSAGGLTFTAKSGGAVSCASTNSIYGTGGNAGDISFLGSQGGAANTVGDGYGGAGTFISFQSGKGGLGSSSDGVDGDITFSDGYSNAVLTLKGDNSQEAYFSGDIYATDFITLSKVADVTDEVKALDSITNMDKWLVTDTKTNETKINYSAHYAGGYKDVEQVKITTYEKVIGEDCKFDEKGKQVCEPITQTEVNKTLEKKTIGYLSMETRVATMEKMIYEIKGFLNNIFDRLTNAENRINNTETNITLLQSNLTTTNNKLTTAELKITSLENENKRINTCLTESEDYKQYKECVNAGGIKP